MSDSYASCDLVKLEVPTVRDVNTSAHFLPALKILSERATPYLVDSIEQVWAAESCEVPITQANM
jgi:hypothetical protein